MVKITQQHIPRIKWLMHCLAIIPLLRLVWLGVNDQLGANPIEFIERSTGTWALVFLLITLSMTPIRLLTGQVWQIQLRRALGLWMFFYAFAHLTTYIWLDHWFDWQEVTKDIVKHPYVLVGFSAFILTIPLAATSNNAMIKKLKTRWKTLHKSVYIVAILAVTHYWWLVKKDITEPIIYASVLSILLAIRLYFKYKKLLNS